MGNNKFKKNVKYLVALFLSLCLVTPFLLTSTSADDGATVSKDTSNGSVTVYYQDAVTNADLIAPEAHQNLEYKKYDYNAKNIDGYKVWEDKSKSVTLTADNPNQTVKFLYYKGGDSAYNGKVQIEFKNLDTKREIKEKVVNNGVHVFDFDATPEKIDGYKFSNTEHKLIKTESGIQLNYVHYYKPVKDTAKTGEVTINCVDENKQLLKTEVKTGLELKRNTINAPSIDNFTVVGDSKKTVDLTEIQPKVTVEFVYKYNGGPALPIEGKAVIIQVDEHDAELGRVTVDKLPLGVESNVDVPSLDGYTPTKNKVAVTPTVLNPVVEVKVAYKKADIGTITIKYLEKGSNKELAKPETKTGLPEGKHKVNAKQIKGYTVEGSGVAEVNITSQQPNQTVTFYYNANQSSKNGSVVINYCDSETKEKIRESKMVTNLEMGLHTFEAIQIDGYILEGDNSQTVVLTPENKDKEITFLYKKSAGGTITPDPDNPPTEDGNINGTVTISYVDESGNKLLNTETFNNLKAGNYSFAAVTIEGYRLIGNDRVFFALSKENPTKDIVFKYSKLTNPGKLYVKYIDKDTGANLMSTKIYDNLSYGTYSYEAETISGYTLVSNQKQSVTLNNSKTEGEIVFLYSSNGVSPRTGTGKVTIKYIDSATGEEISTAEVITDLALQEYTYSAITIDGYELRGDVDKKITLTEAEPEQEITFEYTKSVQASDTKKDSKADTKTNLPDLSGNKDANKSKTIKIGLAVVGGVIAVSVIAGLIVKTVRNRRYNEEDTDNDDDNLE